MSQTEQVSFTLHRGAVDHLRHRIAEGGFNSADEFVESLIVGDMLGAPRSDDEILLWMKTEGARRLQQLHADPSSGLTADQAFAGLLDPEDQQESE